MDQNLDANLVRSVSRSFSLTLLTLPASHRQSVALTYLLARLADTITDAGQWAPDERLNHLISLEKAIKEKSSDSWSLKGTLGSFHESEVDLLMRAKDLIKGFQSLSPLHQDAGREVLATLLQAMRWDLKTFSGAGSAVVVGCNDEATFDWYTYAIAGCVGAYWVKIFGLPSHLEPLAVAYGKGLQRINILRDFCEDYQRGRIYLPASRLKAVGIDLQGEPWKHPAWPALQKVYVKEARDILVKGAHFCDALPYGQIRLRFASALPLLIGWETLKKLEAHKLSPEQKIKISRADVKKIMILAATKSLFNLSHTKSILKG
jgi:farnesyl-diphosphate farnesyltransferase